jgi:hypothetical protein
MIRLLFALVVLLVLPIALKEKAGGLRDLASTRWREGVADERVLAAMRVTGIPVIVAANGSEGKAEAADCKLLLQPADPRGQSLGYLTELSKEYDRLSFLYEGRLRDDFPYLNALNRHILFILLNAVGIENDYRPVIAVFQRGACDSLVRLRQS